MNYINEILEWPIIVQGALGSAIFWLILILGQKITLFISNRLSNYSKSHYEKDLKIERFKYLIMACSETERPTYIISLIYIAMIRMLRGLIWLTLGLVTQSFIPVFGVIGYIGALYNLFLSLKVFKPVESSINANEKIEEIETKLNELQKT